MKFNGKKIVFNTLFNSYSLAAVYFLAAHFLGFMPEESKLLSGAFLVNSFLVFIALGLGLNFVFTALKFESLGDALFGGQAKHSQVFSLSIWKPYLYSILILTILASIYMTKFSLLDLVDRDGFEGAIRLFRGIFSPNFDILPKAILAIIETIYIAFLATFIAVPFAFFLSFLGAKNIMTHPAAFFAYVGLRTFLNIVRSVEPLIWAIIFSVWVGIGPFAGMLALMLHSVASLTKQYSEIVECIVEGPVEGVKATGANTLQTIRFGVVPQIVLPYISFTIYRWDINVRMATVIGLVGGGGIGTMLIQYQGQALWREVGCIVVVIAVVVWMLDTASAYIREAIK